VKTLLLTLGHNSTACVIDNDTRKIIGYEEERLTQIKGDSSFPEMAILEIGRHIDLNTIDTYMISHWFDNFDINKVTKYWDPVTLYALVSNAVYYNPGLSHHDMHAYSALAFAENFTTVDNTWHTLVVDGFGNNQEVISLYKYVGGHPELSLVRRARGYNFSLGLMFQYAAESCNMHPHHDVYKFLGYRSKIMEKETPYLNEVARRLAAPILQRINVSDSANDVVKHDQLIDYLDLEATKNYWRITFEEFNGDRIKIGYLIQAILELVVLDIVRVWGVKKLMVAGGTFYNVRLNHKLADKLERFCPMPLAGDQGGALGAYRYTVGRKGIEFGNLCWGPRRPLIDTVLSPPRFQTVKSFKGAMPLIRNALDQGLIVNVVRPDMEFGPRALCRTSTLARPTKFHVSAINTYNGRDTVMPMAPAVSYGKAMDLFHVEDLLKVPGSDRFMIVAHEYKSLDPEGFRGAALEDEGAWTGRPQIVTALEDPTLQQLLEEVKWDCVINTSFNGHGVPIVFTRKQAMTLHWKWLGIQEEIEGPDFVTFYCIDE